MESDGECKTSVPREVCWVYRRWRFYFVTCVCILVTPIFPIAFFHWESVRTRRLHAVSEIPTICTSAPFLDTCCRLSLAFTSFQHPLIRIVFVFISFVTFAFLSCSVPQWGAACVFIALAAGTDFPACIKNSDPFVSGTDRQSLPVPVAARSKA